MIDRQMVLNGILIAAALELVAIPLFGALSDRVGRRPVYLFGAIMTAAVRVSALRSCSTPAPTRSSGWR